MAYATCAGAQFTVLLAIASFVFISSPVRAQSSHASAAGAGGCSAVQPGLVVESVTKKSAGEKAGLLPGDIILEWNRGNEHGQVLSPFDFSEVEIEQEPRGKVTLQGTRGAAALAWVMGPDKWSIGTRPILPESVLLLYRDGQELARAGKAAEFADRWANLAAQIKNYDCPWLGPWLLSRSANAFADGNDWKQSDALYQQAIESTMTPQTSIRLALQRAWVQTFVSRSDWVSTEKYQTQIVAEDNKLAAGELMTAADLYLLGVAYFRQDQLNQAEEVDHQALDIQQRLTPQALGVARSVNMLGNIAKVHGDLAKAGAFYSQSLTIAQALDPHSLAVALCLGNLAEVERKRGDYVLAEQHHLRELALIEEFSPDSLSEANSLSNLGETARERGDLVKAEEYGRRALAIRQKLAPAGRELADSLNNLGIISRVLGNLAQAEDYFDQALVIQQRLAPESLSTADVLSGLGNLAWEKGDLVNAEKFHQHAVTITREMAPDSLDLALSLMDLGNVADSRGDLSQAEQYYQQALAIQQKLAPTGRDPALSLGDLGKVARENGDLTQAEKYLNQTLTILERVAPDSLDVADTLYNLGDVSYDRGDFGEAEMYYRRALVIQARLAPGSLQKAASLDALSQVAYHNGDLIAAANYGAQALQIWKTLAPESIGYAECLASSARIMRDTHQLAEATKQYGQAVEVLERQTFRLGGSNELRAGFRAKYSWYYSDYANLLVTQNRPDLAFQVIEQSRARILLEVLSQGHVDIREGVDPALLEKERLLQATLTAKTNFRINLLQAEHTKDSLASIDEDLARVLAQIQDLDGQIRSTSPAYASLSHPQPLDLRQVQQQILDADTVLLEYALGADRGSVFVVTSHSLDVFALPERSQVEAAAQQLYALLTAHPPAGETSVQRKVRLSRLQADYNQAAMTLSHMVLAPAASKLTGKRLLVVADGALQYIPFSVLPLRFDEKTMRAIPLIAEHEIVNLPSASVLAVLRKQSVDRSIQPSKQVAVLADPVFDKTDPRLHGSQPPSGQDSHFLSANSSNSAHLTRSLEDQGHTPGEAGRSLPRLAFSRREAAAIIALTKPGQAMEALDFQASRETALSKELSQYRIVHFATHGLLDNEHPELSGVVLSLVGPDGKPQDGFLDLNDVYNLSLPSDLVVLSACETALGKEIRGEGLVGLTRGFMYAGATSVVASLWKVDDVATAGFMGEFYQAMLQQGLRPAPALRQAQLKVSQQKRWSRPYYWAGFTLQGDWK